jgi:hypothetical protein
MATTIQSTVTVSFFESTALSNGRLADKPRVVNGLRAIASGYDAGV